MTSDDLIQRVAASDRELPQEQVVANFVMRCLLVRPVFVALNREIALLADTLRQEKKRTGEPHCMVAPDGDVVLTDDARVAAAAQFYVAAFHSMFENEDHGRDTEFDALVALLAMIIGDRAINDDNSNSNDVLRHGVHVLEMLSVPDHEITRAIVIAQVMQAEIDGEAMDVRLAELAHDPFRHKAEGSPTAPHESSLPSTDQLDARFRELYRGTDARGAGRVAELVDARHESVLRQRRRWRTRTVES